MTMTAMPDGAYEQNHRDAQPAEGKVETPDQEAFERCQTGVVSQQGLEHCRRELLDPRDRSQITEIARRWGFADAATFSRAFRGAYRVNPSTYRARFGA